MKKFKKIIVGAMLVMALGTFTACGNNDDNVNDTTDTQDHVPDDAANDETTGSNKNKNNNNNDNDTDNAGNAVGDAMEDVGDAAGDVGKGVVDGVGEVGEGIKDAAKDMTGNDDNDNNNQNNDNNTRSGMQENNADDNRANR